MQLTVDEIIVKANEDLSDKTLSSKKALVADWCFYILRQIGDSVIGQHVRGETYDVKNSMVCLPEKVLRLESVTWTNKVGVTYNYDKIDRTLSLPFDSGKIKVNYWGVRTDEDGMPLIPEQAEQAIIFYLIYKDQVRKTLSGTAREKNYALPTLNYFDLQWKNEVARVRGEMSAMNKDEVRQLAYNQKKLYQDE